MENIREVFKSLLVFLFVFFLCMHVLVRGRNSENQLQIDAEEKKGCVEIINGGS